MNAKLLENNLRHSRAAYLHAIRALPSAQDLRSGPIRQNGFEFYRASEIESQLVELGWAFFCRYEACLEKWLKEQNVKLSRKAGLKKWLTDNGVLIPEKLAAGIDVYRKIRNALHHDDGAAFDFVEETELHLFPNHMEKFFELFCWIGQQVDRVDEEEGGS